MDEVRAALAAWKTAREAHGAGDAGAAPDAAMALMLKAQAGSAAARAAVDTTAVEATGRSSEGGAAGFAQPGATQQHSAAHMHAIAQAHSTAASDSMGALSPGTLSPTTSVAAAGMVAGGACAASARFTALQEAKEAAEKLALENMRLTKQLQLERSLKDRWGGCTRWMYGAHCGYGAGLSTF